MTETSHTKLLSVRVNFDIIEKLDDYVYRHPYYTRSSLINHILRNTIGNMDVDEFFNLIMH